MVTGIDCSKDYFDFLVLKENKVVVQDRLGNNRKGFKQLLSHVLGTHVAMEATGPYSFQLALFLHESGVKVSVVNPLVIRRFSQMQMSRTKTDKKDALLIAEFTAMTSPKEWNPPRKEILHIRSLETYIDGAKRRRRMLSNQLHAFEAAGTLDKDFRSELKQELEEYRVRIEKKEKEIERLVNKAYARLSENLRSIPGIGPRSASLLIVLTDGFKMFESHKQVISYFGLAPRIFESGSSVKGRNHICKMGMGNIRKVLYMAATSAIQCNRACRELFERLRAKGKPYKVALIAAVNKLIKQAFAIAKSGRPYEENFVRPNIIR